MLRRFLPWLVSFAFFVPAVQAQSNSGKIKGKVTDGVGVAVEFATVILMQGDGIKMGTQADENGDYSFAPVEPGTYEIKASFAGNAIMMTDVKVVALKTTEINITLESGFEMKTVVIQETIPIDQTTTGGTVDQKDIKQMGLRDINTLAAIVPGVYQSDDGAGLNMRGGRSSATTYYVDGVKVRGIPGLPQKSIGQLTVITGGTPAEYGDMIGGIISITTTSPSYNLTGGGEILTSQFLDGFGYNLVALNLSGPIISKRIDSLDYNKPILGFFIAGEAVLQKDQDPPAFPIKVLKDENYRDFQENPLMLSPTGNFFLQRANFITEDMVTTSRIKPNNASQNYRVSARLDFQPSDNIIIKLGATAEKIINNGWGMGGSFLAAEGNQRFEGNLFRGWARFQQNFPGSPDAKVKNLFYTLQADYNLYQRYFMDETHKDKIFDYGYIGKFNYDRQEIYSFVERGDPNYDPGISAGGYYITSGHTPANLSFDPSVSRNPLMANYDKFIFDYVGSNGIINPFTGNRDYGVSSLDFLAFYGGLRNGDSPDGVYSLFSGPGTSPGGYTKFEYEQYRLTGQASGEFKGHAIKVGFEFEQRSERVYSVASRYMWTYMRQLANRHIAGINYADHNSWQLVTQDGVFQDTVHAPVLYDAESQSDFDKNLRTQVLGLDVNGTDYINTDALNPDDLSLSLFSADELLNQGNLLVSYYGYDYTGKKQKRVAEENFFTDLKNRPMNAFSPTYISGFIQDKFELEDIIFNVGVRVDRFDANQKVIKDLFCLFPTYTAQEATTLIPGTVLPSTVDGDWVPYTDNANNPTEVVGYRDPVKNIWYDVNGNPTSSANLRQGGEVQPFIKDDEVSIASFKDYTPQTIVMPRLSFSFPISGDAVFFAHYDVLAQRPGQTGAASGSLLAGQISDYYFLQNSATIDVQNPNLKPERTIDYEVGFKQKLSDFMALSISAFYREMRDMIQIQTFQDAYPINYSSYTNLDFGTVKGFTLALNMIRSGNLRMTASYTMQFASGTGSSFSSSRNAINSLEGFTAIRTLLPLDFDQRHRFAGNIDYRFSDDRKGPGIKMGEKTVYPLANAGANATFYLGSGTPYSVNGLPDASAVMGGINSNIQLKGTPNGSRLPWQFRIDMKFDKDIIVGGRDRKDETGKIMKDPKGNTLKTREYAINVYILLLNAFNIKNTLGVYKTSGLPMNDGFLTTGVGEQLIRNQIDPTSFTYLYTLKMQNPDAFSLPRRIRLGVQFSF